VADTREVPRTRHPVFACRTACAAPEGRPPLSLFKACVDALSGDDSRTEGVRSAVGAVAKETLNLHFRQVALRLCLTVSAHQWFAFVRVTRAFGGRTHSWGLRKVGGHYL